MERGGPSHQRVDKSVRESGGTLEGVGLGDLGAGRLTEGTHQDGA